MTLRRTALWIVVNAAVVLGAVAGTVARPSGAFTGANATGRGGLAPVGTLLLSVFAALVVANLTWLAVVVWKR